METKCSGFCRRSSSAWKLFFSFRRVSMRSPIYGRLSVTYIHCIWSVISDRHYPLTTLLTNFIDIDCVLSLRIVLMHSFLKLLSPSLRFFCLLEITYRLFAFLTSFIDPSFIFSLSQLIDQISISCFSLQYCWHWLFRAVSILPSVLHINSGNCLWHSNLLEWSGVRLK